MADIGSKAVDASALSNGRWFTYVGDARFLIASNRSPAYLAALKNLASRERAKMDDGDSDAGMTEDDFVEDAGKVANLFARKLVRGWENVQIDGAEVPYSQDQSVEFCTDMRWRDLYEWMIERSSGLGNFNERVLRKAEGNSQPA
jgi:hypothetical protein